MKPLKSSRKWILAAIGLLLVLLISKITLILTAKPQITIDYVAEYNSITRPENYDPNDNAAPYYQKAFDAFVEIPHEQEGLERCIAPPGIYWPADFNNAEQTLLENWLASNSQALEFFKIAANKPYYWLERHVDKDGFILDMLITEITPLNHLTNALLWNAKLAALKGQPQTALEDIIDCYRVGCQKCRTPSSLTDQHAGMTLKERAIYSALLILDKTQLDSPALKSFQTALQMEFDKDTYVPDFEAEKLTLYDAMQRIFIDNGRGTGRLAWSKTAGFAVIRYGWTNIKMQLNCFFGPTRNQTTEQIEKVSAISNKIMTITPWQLKNERYDYFGEIERINNSNFLLEILDISPRGIFNIYYKARAHSQALLAALAILRFKADNHRFPATLDELVSGGYLQSVPMDPYSDGPLVYKLTEDNFKLYSAGEDFLDDNGATNVETGEVTRRDIPFWPIKRFERRLKTYIGEPNKAPQN